MIYLDREAMSMMPPAWYGTKFSFEANPYTDHKLMNIFQLHSQIQAIKKQRDKLVIHWLIIRPCIVYDTEHVFPVTMSFHP